MNITKLVITLLTTLLLLSGCGKVITQKQIVQAYEYCEDKEGLFSIEVYGSSLERTLVCKNGDTVDTKRVAVN